MKVMLGGLTPLYNSYVSKIPCICSGVVGWPELHSAPPISPYFLRCQGNPTDRNVSQCQAGEVSGLGQGFVLKTHL